MSNVIEFKRPEPKKDCQHESINVYFDNSKAYCADCYLEVNAFYVLYKFMSCTKWKNNVNINDLEYLKNVVNIHKSIDRQKELLHNISEEVTNKFQELHALESAIRDRKSQINMFE